MIKIAINEVIYRWGSCSEKNISEQLKSAQPGEEIEISINSPGGEVYEGVAVFNLIREYAKSHTITVKIIGLAASMASYIAIAPRTVNKSNKLIVYENSTYFIHNPLCFIAGDYRDLRKEADFLERLAAMVASTYAYISGKAEKEIRSAMDEETYFVGNEIIENGYANDFEKINSDNDEEIDYEADRGMMVSNAKFQIEKAAKNLSQSAKGDLEKAVALLTTVYNPNAIAEAGDHALKKIFQSN